MRPSAQPDNRSAQRSPSGKGRGKRGGSRGRKKPAIHRIQEDAADRTELWAKGKAAKARHREPGIPARTQIANLTDSLVAHYGDRRAEQVGTMEPGSPKTSGAFRG